MRIERDNSQPEIGNYKCCVSLKDAGWVAIVWSCHGVEILLSWKTDRTFFRKIYQRLLAECFHGVGVESNLTLSYLKAGKWAYFISIPVIRATVTKWNSDILWGVKKQIFTWSEMEFFRPALFVAISICSSTGRKKPVISLKHVALTSRCKNHVWLDALRFENNDVFAILTTVFAALKCEQHEAKRSEQNDFIADCFAETWR